MGGAGALGHWDAAGVSGSIAVLILLPWVGSRYAIVVVVRNCVLLLIWQLLARGSAETPDKIQDP